MRDRVYILVRDHISVIYVEWHSNRKLPGQTIDGFILVRHHTSVENVVNHLRQELP